MSDSIEAAPLLSLRDPTPADEIAWKRLWDGYTSFYGAAIPELVTHETWRRILDPRSQVFARLAEVDGVVVGFSVSVLHDGTWTTNLRCYLEDLFVTPSARGRGVGHSLINDLLALGRERGWSRLYWHTDTSNRTARRLYDLFAQHDGVVRYTVNIG
jgi:GNAT superfamily N-acetyltransferase